MAAASVDMQPVITTEQDRASQTIDETLLSALPADGIKVEDLTPSLPPEYLHDVIQYVRDQQTYKNAAYVQSVCDSLMLKSEESSIQSPYNLVDSENRLHDVEKELDEICWVFTSDWQPIASSLLRPHSAHDYCSEGSNDGGSELDSSVGSECASLGAAVGQPGFFPASPGGTLTDRQNACSSLFAVLDFEGHATDSCPQPDRLCQQQYPSVGGSNPSQLGGQQLQTTITAPSQDETGQHCGQNGWWRAACASPSSTGSSVSPEAACTPPDDSQHQSADECLMLKRPKNGFIRFAMAHRRQVAAQHPHMDNREISRILGVKWRKLTLVEKHVYEDEFHQEMEERRKRYPAWNYGARKKPVDSAVWEPIPSRLRPREKLKRKHIPRLTRPYVRRETAAPVIPVPWVQCDRCDKWRRLPPWVDVANIAGKWFCEYNFPPRDYCDAEEEREEQKVKQAPEEELLAAVDFTDLLLFSSSLPQEITSTITTDITG